MKTLVLNAGYEPLQLISWQRALCLVLSSRAEVVAEYGKYVRTVSAKFALPSVVRLTRYVRIVRRIGLVRCNRRNVLLRDRNQCQYCGIQCSLSNISIDHIVPRSRGGRTTWDNVVACCHSCNRRKGDRSPRDVDMKLLRKPQRPGWHDLLGEVNEDLERSWLPYILETG